MLSSYRERGSGGGGGRWGTSLTLSWEYTARSTPVLHIMTINIPKKSCVRISRKPVNHSSTENIKKPSYNLYCLSERRMVNGRKFSLETLYSGQFTLKLLPTLKGRKNRFFFYLTKKFNLTFPLKKNFLKFSEAPKWFSETYFQIKVNKSGRCHNIGPGWIPGGGNRSSQGSFSCHLPVLFTSRTCGSSLLVEKSNAEDSPN